MTLCGTFKLRVAQGHRTQLASYRKISPGLDLRQEQESWGDLISIAGLCLTRRADSSHRSGLTLALPGALSGQVPGWHDSWSA